MTYRAPLDSPLRDPTRREQEQLEQAKQSLESDKLSIMMQAEKAHLYYEALKISGFTPDQALEICKATLGLVRR